MRTSRRGVGDTKCGLGYHDIDLAHILRDSSSDEMAILLAGVVACKKYVKASNVDKEHRCAQYMTGRVRCDTDARDGMSCMEVDCLNLRERTKVVLFGVENVALV
jgi:hypothetical protein